MTRNTDSGVQEEGSARPLFSRCSLGRNRWFWVTYRDFEACCDRDVDASGFAPTAAEAEEQARASIRDRVGSLTPEQLQTYFASGVHRRRILKRRASHAAKSATDPKAVEFVYCDYESDYDGSTHSSKHRIVKKTAKRVYVERDCDSWTEEDGGTYHDVETFVLDRHELETTGCTYSRCRRDFFYTTPCEVRRRPSVPRRLEMLGLPTAATSEAVHAAYRRLAKMHHPDHGGSEEDFKALHRAYERALSCCAETM